MHKNLPIEVTDHDISQKMLEQAINSKTVAWDIETSGLNWKEDRIGTCQILVPEVATVIVQLTDEIPKHLSTLLSHPDVVKIFHHALFDLRFMSNAWSCVPSNIVCTKILSKIIDPELEPRAHSLKQLIERNIGIIMDKSQQVSDWTSGYLSNEQLSYAANDVKYLHFLYESMLQRSRDSGLFNLVAASFDYIPTRVATDLRGCGDIFIH